MSLITALDGSIPVFVGPAWYVNSAISVSGNGTTWASAWKNFSNINWPSVNPGDTIFIGGGNYGILSIIKGGTPGNPITFKRATISAHGTSTGWSNSYDGQVIIDGGGDLGAIGIGEGGAYTGLNYITIDGATRYGIKTRNAQYGVRADREPQSNNITLRYLELGETGAGKLGEDGIQGVGDNLLVEYCYIHDVDSTVTHGDGIQWAWGDNTIVRYNIIKNSGQVIMFGSEVWSTISNDVSIYYNLFYNRGGTHYNGITLDRGTPAAGRFVHVYNNTFDLEATDNSGYNNVFNIVAPVGLIDFKNNAVIYSNAGSVSNATHSFNAYDNSGAFAVYNIPTETGRVVAADLGFVNVAAANYHLLSTSPLRGAGVNVGLTQDFDGNAVPATPDIGAFQYV